MANQLENLARIPGIVSSMQGIITPKFLLEAFDGDHDGTIRHGEFSSMLDRSRDSSSGTGRSIMEMFFALLAGSDQAIDVERDAPRVPGAFRQAARQVTGHDFT